MSEKPSPGYDFMAKARTLQTLEDCDAWEAAIRHVPTRWDRQRREAVWARRAELTSGRKKAGR